MDSTALQYENQKLVQQLEAQKSEMHALGRKFKELRDECSYDKTLVSLNKLWNQLIDDLVLLGVRAGGDLDNLQALDHEELSEESLESCPSEEIFLLRLLKSNNIRDNSDTGLLEFVEEALAFRCSATVTLMKSLQETISSQQARSESLSLDLNGHKSNEDVIVALQNHNDCLKEVAENASQAISIINEKHKRYLDEIEAFKSNHSSDLQEIKRVSATKPSLLSEALASAGRPLSLRVSKRLVEFASRPMILHQVSTIAPSLGQTESSLHVQFLDGRYPSVDDCFVWKCLQSRSLLRPILLLPTCSI